jgi:Tol biopolymer transport system component
VNSGQHDSYPSVTKDGTLYFFSRRDGGLGHGDIYRSTLSNGEYTQVENLGKPINTEYHEVDPYIAQDESYIIFCSDKPGGFGKADFYISFRRDEGLWTEAVHMGGKVNSPQAEYIPYVTPDGKYFFFTSNKSGNRDIYWVDAKIIDELKQRR